MIRALVKFFRQTAPATVLCHLGAISLKNLTKRKEVRKGADQANSKKTAIFFQPRLYFQKVCPARRGDGFTL